MSDMMRMSAYSNSVAIMLILGLIVLASKLRSRDELEKKIFLSLLGGLMAMCVFYMLTWLRDSGVMRCDRTWTMLIETGLEILINLFAVHWFVYVDYRMYHSVGHLMRSMPKILLPVGFAMLFDIVNIFTGIFFYFDDSMQYTETRLYIICDFLRIIYFILSLVVLTIHKKNDERMKFFSVMPFLVPSLLYLILHYITPFGTLSLGLAIGMALLYTSMINEQCYLDGVTGFYNKLYLEYLKGRMKNDDYALESAIIFRLREEDMEKAAGLITKQLPEDCDTVRYGKDTVITLAKVNERGPLYMLAEDVQMSLEEAGMAVEIDYKLKKKKVSCVEFLDSILERA